LIPGYCSNPIKKTQTPEISFPSADPVGARRTFDRRHWFEIFIVIDAVKVPTGALEIAFGTGPMIHTPKRNVAIGIIVLIVGAIVTVFGTSYALHRRFELHNSLTINQDRLKPK
jgi:hypothetical protein